MGQVPLFGVNVDPATDPLAFARVIFAAQQRTLLELGIGPIVTAGLLMQLLKGSDILKLNFKDPNDRSLFTSATKIVTIIVIVAETLLYGSERIWWRYSVGLSFDHTNSAVDGGVYRSNVP